MVSLIDALHPDFDNSSLANENDATLYSLQAKAEKAVADWESLSQNRPLDPREQTWHIGLKTLSKFIGLLLLVRYGCND